MLGANESYAGLGTVVAYAILFFDHPQPGDHGPTTRSRLILASVVAAGVAATYALVQVAGLDPILYGRTSGLAGLIRPFATMGTRTSCRPSSPWPSRSSCTRWCAPSGPASAGSPPSWPPSWSWPASATAASVSRGAWLALAAAVIVLALGALAIGERRVAGAVALVSAGAVLALGVLAIVLPAGRGIGTLASLAQRVRQFGESASRQAIWQAAWDIFRDHPLIGTGLDTFQIAFADKRTVAYWNLEWNGSPTRAHNEALNILATQGLLGGLAVLVLVIGVVIAARRALRSRTDRPAGRRAARRPRRVRVQDLFSFTVAGCGTLAVTQAALLSRLAIGTAARPHRRRAVAGRRTRGRRGAGHRRVRLQHLRRNCCWTSRRGWAAG